MSSWRSFYFLRLYFKALEKGVDGGETLGSRSLGVCRRERDTWMSPLWRLVSTPVTNFYNTLTIFNDFESVAAVPQPPCHKHQLQLFQIGRYL